MINVTKTLKKCNKFIIVAVGIFLFMCLINVRSNRLEAFSLEFEDKLSDDYEDEEDDDDYEDDEQVTEETMKDLNSVF